jgi:hypothetical protein
MTEIATPTVSDAIRNLIETCDRVAAAVASDERKRRDRRAVVVNAASILRHTARILKTREPALAGMLDENARELSSVAEADR